MGLINLLGGGAALPFRFLNDPARMARREQRRLERSLAEMAALNDWATCLGFSVFHMPPKYRAVVLRVTRQAVQRARAHGPEAATQALLKNMRKSREIGRPDKLASQNWALRYLVDKGLAVEPENLAR
jgi:hypothetical protein